MLEMDEKVKKLPMWAQGYISHLKRSVSELRKDLDATKAGKSEVAVHDMVQGSYEYLCPGSRVRFALNDEMDMKTKSVEAYVYRNRLVILGVGLSSFELDVRPSAGNALSIGTIDVLQSRGRG